MLINEHDSELT